MYKKGFTLIELLVVIAIIGILSSVVLASLNSARGKGSDAAVKAGMENFRAQAAMYYDTAQTYGTNSSNACSGANAAGTVFTDPQGANIIANIISNANSGVVCVASGTSGFRIIAPLKSTSGVTGWCADGNGNSTSTLTGSTTATYLCQ